MRAEWASESRVCWMMGGVEVEMEVDGLEAGQIREDSVNVL